MAIHPVSAGPVCLFLLWCGVPSIAADPAQLNSVFMVDRFDMGGRNALLGYCSDFQRAPSAARIRRVEEPCRGALGRSLRIHAVRRQTGFCGAWIPLFDRHAEPPVFFDARDFAALSFWVQGAVGGETFSIKLADQAWVEKEDSLALGCVEQYLAGGVTADWREVVVPLNRDPRLDWSRLGAVVLEFATTGEYEIAIDDLGFKRDAAARVPTSARSDLPPPVRLRQPRAMWLWSTSSLLANADQWQGLFDFCQAEQVIQVWAQLTYRLEPPIWN